MTAKRGPKGDAAPKRTTKRKAKAAKKTPTPKATGKRAPAVLAVPLALANKTSRKLKPANATGKRRGSKAEVQARSEKRASDAEADANNTRPVGRPTKYRSKFCDQVRALGQLGKSKAQMAAKLGISRQAWHEWLESHPEFGDAVKDAEWLAQAWWEDKGQDGIIMGKDFNANAWRYQVANRFHYDYKDRRQVEHDTSDALSGLLRELDGATGRFR